jgi:hypothetical protein
MQLIEARNFASCPQQMMKQGLTSEVYEKTKCYVVAVNKYKTEIPCLFRKRMLGSVDGKFAQSEE